HPRRRLVQRATSLETENSEMAIYLKIPNILGDSTSKAYPNQFQVLSLTWGGVNPEINGIPGKINFMPISISKYGSPHSPTLMLMLAKGMNLGTVVITTTFTTAVGVEEPVDVITLSNAF